MSIEQQHDPAPADSLVGLTVKLDRDIGCEKHRPDTSPILRPYQSEVVAQVEQLLGTAARPLIVAPTGSGKTIIFCEIIKRAVANHQRVLVLAHRREIIKHTSAKLRANGVRHGVVMAGEDNALRPQEPVQVCAIATLWVRAIRTNKISLPPADLIVIDEAHHAPARTYQRIVEAFPSATVIGCTATPCRGDGRGLGGIFTTLVETPQIATLIVQRYLVRSRVYAPVTDHDLNLKSVTVRKGDYAENELAERMDRAKLIGDIVTHWHKFGERRKTLAFAVNVAHSIHLRDEFVRSGVHAEHIDGSTPKEERDAALARLASGETEVIVNCMVLTEGFDCPDIGCIIVARPTKKMGLYRQMIGRGLRPADGKTDCVILDHSGATFQHGLPEDYIEWTLDPDHRAVAPAHQARLDRKVPSGNEEDLPRELLGLLRGSMKDIRAIQRLPIDEGNGVLLRAKTAAAQIVFNAQLRADEQQLRRRVKNDVLDRLLKIIEEKKNLLSPPKQPTEHVELERSNAEASVMASGRDGAEEG
jgi:DNA repair protein RadD